MYMLDPYKIKIEKNEKNLLTLTTQDGKIYNKINFLLLFPFTDQENYVSAVIRKGSEYTEIGIIKHLKNLPKNMYKYVREDLKLRYFVPEIKDIKSIKERKQKFPYSILKFQLWKMKEPK